MRKWGKRFNIFVSLCFDERNLFHFHFRCVSWLLVLANTFNFSRQITKCISRFSQLIFFCENATWSFILFYFRIRLPKPIGSWYLVAIFGNFKGCGNGEKDLSFPFLFVFWREKSNLFPLPVCKLTTGDRKYVQFFLVKSQRAVLDLHSQLVIF